MLQWMGGSRKKVATSRKSTYQRQKQYFEQRRRQQQTAGLDAYDDGKQSCNRNFESTRSLDIMSLPNIVSTTTQNNVSPPLNARDDSEDDYSDYDASDIQNPCSPVLYASETIPVVECQEQNPSSYRTDNDYLKNISRSLCDTNETLAGQGKKHNNLKLSPVSEISIFDLVDDDDDDKPKPNDAEETTPNAHESHVAFSVEGLGKVEPETPVHSPKMPGRCNPYGSPRKQTRKKHLPCKLLDGGLFDLSSAEIRKPIPPAIWSGNAQDVKMQEFDLSCRDGFLGQSLRSCDITGDANHLINPSNPSPFNWNCNSFQGASGGDEQSYGIHESDIWNGPNFVEGKIDEVRGYESFRDNWMDQRDFACDDDYFNSSDHWSQDISFGSWNLQNKRSRGITTMKEIAFDMPGAVFEEPLPYTRRHVPDELDFRFTHTRGYCTFRIDDDVKDLNPYVDDTETLSLPRYSTFRIDDDVKDLKPFVDDTETLSLPSEESSTSPAAKSSALKTLIYQKMT